MLLVTGRRKTQIVFKIKRSFNCESVYVYPKSNAKGRYGNGRYCGANCQNVDWKSGGQNS